MSQLRHVRKVLGCCLLLLAMACGSGSTTGRPVSLQTEVRAEPPPDRSFTTHAGWSVRLSEAQISIAALYYFDGEPAYVMRRPSLRERFASLSLLSVAHAHPGHYLAGNALGQMTTPAFADLFAGATALPLGSGVSGVYRSARFAWGTPRTEPALSQLGGKIARVSGTASKDGKIVYFRISAELADVARSVPAGQVDGCVLDEAEVESDGRITARIDPSTWFKLVDFTDVIPGTPEAPTDIAAGTTPQVAFALGLAQLSAYHFSFSP
jgi:hypothetical protein